MLDLPGHDSESCLEANLWVSYLATRCHTCRRATHYGLTRQNGNGHDETRTE
jgi:hypothetical protein